MKPTAGSVFGRDIRLTDRVEGPLDRERGIVPSNAALSVAEIEPGRFVEYVRGFRENDKTVTEALWYPQEFDLVTFEVEPLPLAKIGRSRA